MKDITIAELYSLDETIAKDIFEGATYPWEVLPKIHDFIIKLGSTLPSEEYEKRCSEPWLLICWKTARSRLL